VQRPAHGLPGDAEPLCEERLRALEPYMPFAVRCREQEAGEPRRHRVEGLLVAGVDLCAHDPGHVPGQREHEIGRRRE
jgi:hypothetical protein